MALSAARKSSMRFIIDGFSLSCKSRVSRSEAKGFKVMTDLQIEEETDNRRVRRRRTAHWRHRDVVVGSKRGQ